MTDQPGGNQSSSGAAPGEAAALERLRGQRLRRAQPRSLLAFIPRRDLAKGAVLVVLLVAIVVMQRSSGSLVKRASEIFFGPTPATKQAAPKEAPRLRLETPVKAP